MSAVYSSKFYLNQSVIMDGDVGGIVITINFAAASREGDFVALYECAYWADGVMQTAWFAQQRLQERK